MINKAGKELTWLFVLKILSRILDLVLNILVIRDLEPGIYGLTTNLDLLTNITLFYSKIVLKQTYSRVKDADELQTQSAVNLMYLGSLVSIFIAPFVTLIICYNHDVSFIKAAILYAIAAIIDSASEPYAVQWVIQLKLHVVAKSESAAVFVKTVVLYILLKQTGGFDTIVIFGIAHLFYSITIFFYLYFVSVPTKFKPLNQQKVYILPDMKSVGYQFSLMALMKFLLQELEKIVMVVYNNPAISGEYTLVSHIGSLVPRFIFQNIEQVAYNLFPKVTTDEQSQLINKYLKFTNLVGMSIFCAGVPCAQAFLSIYGQQWTAESCVLAMQIYCIYIWIMGVNGITESFVNSTIAAQNMWWYRYLLIAQTIIYSLSLVTLVQLGSSGIILSNCLSMLVRIAISILIISRQQIKINYIKTLPKYYIIYFLGFGLQYFFQGFVLLFVTAAFFGLLGLLNLRTVLSIIKS